MSDNTIYACIAAALLISLIVGRYVFWWRYLRVNRPESPYLPGCFRP